jgi:organic hydroperoxide reductase OsmC/OhrA
MGAADHDEPAAIVHWAVEHCPVTDAVRRAIPMTVDVQTIDGRTRPKEK